MKTEDKKYMENIRVVIVEDSPFSITMIREMLERNGFEVVGTAGSLEEVKAVIKDTKPSLVTMDMTLPGTDGLECTRAIHEIDESIKVIVISSMMDDELVKEAKKSNVSAYLQKPVEDDDLITAIHRVMASEELYQFLQDEYATVFKEALKDSVNRTTKNLLTYEGSHSFDKEYNSEGMTVIIGIIGKFAGRMLLDVSKETAKNLATAALKREPKDNDEITAFLGELSNIVSGMACSILNRKNKALGLRVAPPSILYGEKILISPPNFTTSTSVADTAFGQLLLNVGFARSGESWT